MVLAGNTPQEARKALTEWGLTMPRSGKPISYPSIYQVLSNPRYAGKVPDPDDPSIVYEAAFEPMITADEYDRIQQILGQKGKPRLCGTKYFAFRGLFRCGECGGGVSPQTKNKRLKDGTVRFYTYYRCNMKRKCSQKKSAREEDLIDQANKILSKYSISQELYDWGLKALEKISAKELAERDNVHTAHLITERGIQKQLDGLLDKFTLDLISAEDYKKKNSELNDRSAKIRDHQVDISSKSHSWFENVGKTLIQLTNAAEHFSDDRTVSKKHILTALGNSISLSEGKIELIPFPWLDDLTVAIKNKNLSIETVSQVIF